MRSTDPSKSGRVRSNTSKATVREALSVMGSTSSIIVTRRPLPSSHQAWRLKRIAFERSMVRYCGSVSSEVRVKNGAIFAVRNMAPFFTRTSLLTLPQYLTIERSNAIRFSRHAWWDEGNGRLVTMIEEVDPMTLNASRTVAFDVFDLTLPLFEGSVERIYEDVTELKEDEVKHQPVVVGPFVYVIGEKSGLQSYGSCGQVTGRIELSSPKHLTCGGATLHGWVTGINKIERVEIFLGSTPLGPAILGGPLRNEVSSKTPVSPWSIRINLDTTPRGEQQLRAIGTDVL